MFLCVSKKGAKGFNVETRRNVYTIFTQFTIAMFSCNENNVK